MNKNLHLFSHLLLISLFYVFSPSAHSSEGRVSLNFTLSFGSHETHAKLGLLTFGILEDNNFAIEAGLGLWAQASFKRFGHSQIDWSTGYESFALAGFGNNSNLLGSSLSSLTTQTFYNEDSEGSFFGIGLGVSDEWSSTNLNELIHQTGKIYLRLANRNNSLHIGFENDLKASLLRGEGKDYGITASADVGFTSANSNHIQQYRLGFLLFTPKPDFNKEPNNTINSGDGRKRVWFTQSPLDSLFNGNFYFSATWISDDYALSSQIGVDSKKLGAKLQNDIHDEFGLVPRFPWPVEQDDTLLWNVVLSKNLSTHP